MNRDRCLKDFVGLKTKLYIALLYRGYQTLKKPLGIKIDGCIYATNEEDIIEEEFWNVFIKFIEEKGWYFGGGLNQIDEEGNYILDIKESTLQSDTIVE